ncbi:unnamed protein product [Phyllotreta striolata]|uniref:Cytochrome P450 monooxygenase n=1 Tax=Phyllotreta striolata TaxID=444603 RepID=A0A9N9TPP8_PHYSR|nr:unnamed protein product [Phyllotreta striolata]
MTWIPNILVFFATVSILTYFYVTRRFNYWRKRNVFYQKPTPFFGNFKDVVLMKDTIGTWLRKTYESAKSQPYYGIFIFDEPCLVVKDPKIIKNVLIKDFNSFSDRATANAEHNKVLRNFLFFMRNPEWKSTRNQMSPIFTSGKLKAMFPTLSEVGERFQKYIGNNLGVIEAKEASSKFSTDFIAKAFFGINAHCFDDENAIFRVLGRKVFDFSVRNGFVSTAYFCMQNVVKLFKLNFTEQWIIDYFADSFLHAYESRVQSGTRPNDFIDLLIDTKKKDFDGKFDINMIKGAGMQFFLAGFETTSSTVSYTLYELCLNKNIQNKLRQEILASIKEHNGLTYDGVLGMKYLDMCIKETLRKYPVLPFLDRKCLTDYKVPGTDLVVEKGTTVYIPLFGLQYDEKYFPEPEKYDPERFLDAKKYNMDGLVYLPFGEGPRACIGERQGLLQSKLGVISVLSKFEVEKCAQTPDPIEFEAKSLVLQSKVGLPMTFKLIVPSPA